jgi:metallophosphoesterase (TIGR00282 family)|tara:strand:- start:519 stop:1352 length:834 start_codon:yes stop_codon:yes gene_type:complete
LSRTIRLLFIGDIVGKPGRELTRRAIPPLIDRYSIDLVVANVENAAGGFGVTREIGESIREYGVDVMTSGNHIWDKKEVIDYIPTQPRLIRPANYPEGTPGHGHYEATTALGDMVTVINIMGQVFMANLDNPFRIVLEAIEKLSNRTPIILVDFHAETTSEKMAMGWHLNGKVTAVVGTHTHVQTADNRVLSDGTAYITDVGMTGPHDSVIGVKKQAALTRFLTGMPARFETATDDPRLNGVVITADSTTGRATDIERISLSVQDIENLTSLNLSVS